MNSNAMTRREIGIRHDTLAWFVGCVYSALNETVPDKVRDLDEILQEIIDDQLEPDSSGELAEQHRRLLREGIQDALGCHAVHIAAQAKDLLTARTKSRDGLTPEYSEADL